MEHLINSLLFLCAVFPFAVASAVLVLVRLIFTVADLVTFLRAVDTGQAVVAEEPAGAVGVEGGVVVVSVKQQVVEICGDDKKLRSLKLPLFINCD